MYYSHSTQKNSTKFSIIYVFNLSQKYAVDEPVLKRENFRYTPLSLIFVKIKKIIKF